MVSTGYTCVDWIKLYHIEFKRNEFYFNKRKLSIYICTDSMELFLLRSAFLICDCAKVKSEVGPPVSVFN